MSLDPRLRSAAPYALAAISVGMVAVVYGPLIHTYFVADDFSNMLTVVNRGPLFFIVQPFGGHMLFLRNTVFWLNHLVFGMHSEGYGWFILITHLLNTVLFFRVARGFTKSAVLGAFAAAFWGTSPLLSGALEWYSVYGQVLSGTFLLLVFGRIAAADETRGTVPWRSALNWSLLLVLGATCFGVGIALALTFPLAAALLLPRSFRVRRVQTVFLALPVAVVLLYYGWRVLYARFYPMPFAETFMSAMAFSAIRPIFVLFGHLLSVATIGLAEGFAFVPSTYPASGRWVIALFVGLIATGLALGDGDGRRRLLAFLLVTATVYGFIALGRANLYAMFKMPPEVAATTPRYHYVGTIPLALTVPVVLQQIARRVRSPALVPAIVFAGWAVAAALAFRSTPWKVDVHEAARVYVAGVLQAIEAKVDAAPPGAEVYLPNPAAPYLITGPVLGYADIPGSAGFFALKYDEDEVRGRHVHFIEPNDHQGAFKSPENRRLSTLFVPPR